MLVRIWAMVASRSAIAVSTRCAGRARPEGAGQGLQGQAGGEQPLDDVVVQVRGDPFALVEHRGALLLDPGRGEFDRDRGLVGEPGGQLQVVGGERGPAADPGQRQHPVHPGRSTQRHHQHRADIQGTGCDRRQPGLVAGVGQAQRLPGGEHPPGQRPLPRHRQAGQILGAGADGHLDPQVGPVLDRPDQGDQVGVGDLPAAGGDQLQRVAGTDPIGAGSAGSGDSSWRVIAAVACSHSPRERAAW